MVNPMVLEWMVVVDKTSRPAASSWYGNRWLLTHCLNLMKIIRKSV